MIQKLRRLRWIIVGRIRLRRKIDKAAVRGPVRIVLGASTTTYDGWISTDLPHFNILKESHWRYLFGARKADRMLAEHVMEHLSENDVRQALQYCRRYLKPGGLLRIAVPDGYHPDPRYQAVTQPPADGHLSSWNHENLSSLLQREGFRVVLHEYYTAGKQLVLFPFDTDDGLVKRSIQRGFVSPRVAGYSSLIVDAVVDAVDGKSGSTVVY